MGIGYVIYVDGDGPIEYFETLPDLGTNNIAEYVAVSRAIEKAQQLAKKLGTCQIIIHSDSQLVINQINDEWTVRQQALKGYYKLIKEQLYNSPHEYEFIWVPRETAEQKLADALSKKGNPFFINKRKFGFK